MIWTNTARPRNRHRTAFGALWRAPCSDRFSDSGVGSERNPALLIGSRRLEAPLSNG
jgi:hypothetical protein